MRKAPLIVFIIFIAALAVLAALFLLWRSPLGPPQATQEPLDEGEGIVTLAENLDTPWGIAFLPDGTMLFTERGGRVSALNGSTLTVLGELKVHEQSESGLHGVAVDPQFAENRFVYLYYTRETGNRVSRFTLRDTLEGETVLLDNIPNARFHDGGRIAFGPDGMLYVTTGDATMPSTAQDNASLAGKILRMTRDGGVPADNPFGNYVWSYGHRNPQGLAWDEDGTLYASEHGPTMHDEINVIVKGGNYGWPAVCGEDPAMTDPLRCYPGTTIAPAGIAWANGSLYVAGLRGAQLRRLEISGGNVTDEEIVVDDLGRIRDVVAHDGYLYIATSNRDGRGVPAVKDDRILRMLMRKD